ncbi:nucleotidyltransferase [Rhodanobacter ginsengisoli]|uniref:Nucleotidyltransferase n=1 Tax=Rhodanobacter ginsengisoli TaxID=418646 RepID=A0ABW0QRV8_9GAMM
MNISENNLTSLSKGPGQTESDKCSNAETAVRKAIKASAQLAVLDISVFAQGSYRARTNVRQNSDVDISVRYNATFFDHYPEGMSREAAGNIPGTMAFADFKNMVQKALVDYFGKGGVTRGNKAFDVHANTYRIDADVVPTLEYRRYTGQTNADGSHHYLSGVAFDPDSGERIINWPEQTYNNGVNRNTATGRKYKRVIRILKRLRDKMRDEDVAIAKKTSSFLIECLVWNADVDAFSKDSYTAIVRHVLADLWSRTRKDEDCSEWGEVNELKYLFRSVQPWTRREANEFLQAAWNHIGYQ